VNLGTKAKLDIFQALIHRLADASLDPGFIETLNMLCTDTGNASGELRNFLFHGGPLLMKLSDDETIEFWAKFSARKGGMRGTMVRLSPEYVDNNADHIRDLVDRWVTAKNAVKQAADIVALSDRESHGSEDHGFELQINLAEPKPKRGKSNQTDHRPRQHQSDHGSRTTSPTPRHKPSPKPEK
jgi:hypothetical protein